MATATQRTSREEARTSKNVAIITDKLQKVFLKEYRRQSSQLEKMQRSNGDIVFMYKYSWFNLRFADQFVLNTYLDAADVTFGRWFQNRFGIDVKVSHTFLTDTTAPSSDYCWTIAPIGDISKRGRRHRRP